MTRHRTTIHSAILVQFSAMRSIGPGRSRCGRADPGVAQGSHLVVAHQNLRWDGVGSTRCSHKSLSLTLTTRGVQRGEPTDKPKAETTQNSRATRNCTESSPCRRKCALRGNHPISLRGLWRSAGAFGQDLRSPDPTPLGGSLGSYAGRQCRRSSTNVEGVEGTSNTPRG